MRHLALVLALSCASCSIPREIKEAEIEQAVIFDSVSSTLLTLVQASRPPTAEAEAKRAELLKAIELQRANWLALHSQVARWLDTPGLARLMAEAKPVFADYVKLVVGELERRGLLKPAGRG